MSVLFSKDGTTLVGADSGGSVRFWDSVSGEEQSVLPGPAVDGLALSPDGRTLAVASYESALLVDMETRARVAELRGHTDALTSVAFSPDGRTLVTSSYDGSVIMWSLALNEELISFPGRAVVLLYPWRLPLALSADGRFLAAGGSTDVRLFRAAAE